MLPAPCIAASCDGRIVGDGVRKLIGQQLHGPTPVQVVPASTDGHIQQDGVLWTFDPQLQGILPASTGTTGRDGCSIGDAISCAVLGQALALLHLLEQD